MEWRDFLRAQEQWLDPDRQWPSWSEDVFEDEPPMCPSCRAIGTEEHDSGCNEEEK